MMRFMSDQNQSEWPTPQIEKDVENQIRKIGRVMCDYVSEQLYPRNMADYIEQHGYVMNDDEILRLLRAIDKVYVARFGENPYEKLMESKTHEPSLYVSDYNDRRIFEDDGMI